MRYRLEDQWQMPRLWSRGFMSAASMFGCVTVLSGGLMTAAHAQLVGPETRSAAIDFRRYAVPAQCLSVVNREVLHLWRAPLLRDTFPYRQQIEHDRLPSSSITAARECLTNVRDVSLRQTQRITLAQVALLASDTALLDRVVDSVIVGSAQDREGNSPTWLVGRLLSGLRDPQYVAEGNGVMQRVRPLQYVELVERALNRVPCDSVLCMERIWARGAVRRHYRGVGQFASAAQHSDTLVSDFTLILPEKDHRTGRVRTWSLIAAQAEVRESYDDHFVTAGREAAGRAWEVGRDLFRQVGERPDSPFVDLPTRDYFTNFVIYDSLFRFGKRVQIPRLIPTVWLDKSGAAASVDSGKVRLFVWGGQEMIEGMLNGVDNSYNIFNVAAVLRRLHAKYAASGFEIVWVMNSRGHFRDSPVLTFEEEQRELRKYFFEYLNAPGVIALDSTVFQTRHDGRVFPEPTYNQSMFGAFWSDLLGTFVSPFPSLVLVDQSGSWVTSAREVLGESNDELRLMRLIEQALGASSPRASTHPSASDQTFTNHTFPPRTIARRATAHRELVPAAPSSSIAASARMR